MQVKELVRDYCEPWKSAFEWMGEGTVAWHMGMQIWDPREEGHRWNGRDTGSCTLAGGRGASDDLS